MNNQWVIAALYQFKALNNLEDYKQKLLSICKSQGILGTLILAEEGINGTVAGSREGIDKLKKMLLDLGFDQMEYKESFEQRDKVVFYRMKIKIKKEIVTMRVAGIVPDDQKGQYLSPREWHELIQDPDVVILDTRNEYEFQIGTFKNAINPEINHFVDFPAFLEAHREEWKNKKIAMFCSCEKSTSYATNTNFGQQVYHLKGGILKYLEEIPESEGLWEGECFVFDYRVSVGYKLVPGKYTVCFTCRMPLSPEETTSPLFAAGISCPYCHDTLTDKQKKRFSDRQYQIALGHCHLG